ncbi:eCIS core domain-containing protein [Portibacter marinus]|uniref:eCIS core domain-containing protein n=1 Tax=Portibacter marinus TaxID=2898660 RepID=UPI001F445296|nr:DUF4157 domain-containing protein [Portibacter marinus]
MEKNNENTNEVELSRASAEYDDHNLTSKDEETMQPPEFNPEVQVVQNKTDGVSSKGEEEDAESENQTLLFANAAGGTDDQDEDGSGAGDSSGNVVSGAGAPIQKKENDISPAGDTHKNVPNEPFIPSSVNLHTDSPKASELGALAFAQGSDIHFAPGQFKPDTRSGQELIGHELGHVIQQKEGRVKPNFEAKGTPVNNDPSLEKEADNFGVAFADSLQNRDENPIQQKLGGGFKSSLPVQRKENTVQMWPSLPSWDDVKDTASGIGDMAGDAWDATGGRVVDAVGDGIDWASERIDDAWDAGKELALEQAIRALNGAEAILNFLGELSEGIARKAIQIMARIDYTMLIDILVNSPAYKLADYVIAQLARVIDNVQQIISILARVSKKIAEKILSAIASIDIQKIVNFLLEVPGHIFAAYCFLLLNALRMAEVLAAISIDAAAAIIRKIVNHGKFVINIVRAIIMQTVEFMRSLLIKLGKAIIRILIEGYRMFLEVVKVVIDYIWPVGYGINLEGGIGATFGIPLHVGVDYVSYIQHKSTEVMYFFRQGIVKGGLDTGVGAGVFVGSGHQKGGSGDQQGQEWGLGAEAGANLEAGLQMKLIQEFDFPIYEDVAFISFMLAATGSDSTGISGLTTKLVDQVPGVNLDPMRYNTKTKMEFGVYGSASAEANAGLRLGGNQSGNQGRSNQPNTWGTDGQNPDAQRGNTNQRVDAPWYSPMNLLNKLNVGAGANLNLSAGIGVELRPADWREDSEGNREPHTAELDVFGEGSIAANINASLPVPLPLNGLGVDSTVGVKATWAFVKSGSGFFDFDSTFKGASPYFETGDMDLFNGPASETELNSEGSMLNFEEFIEGISGLKHRQRIGLASSFGRKFMSSSRRQGAVKSLLGKDYKHTGINFGGFLTYGLEISKANLQSILRTLFEFHKNHLTDGNWQNMLIDFIRFFKTGEIPGYMITLIADIVSKTRVTELKVRLQGGIGLAAGAQAAEGAKIRLDGRFAAGVFRETDMIAELGDGVLTSAEIEDLLRNGTSYVGLSVADNSAGASPSTESTGEQTQEQEPAIESPETASADQLISENEQQEGLSSSSENRVSSELQNGPQVNTPQSAPGDSMTSSTVERNEEGDLEFNQEALREDFIDSTFEGEDSLTLRLAMMSLYSNPRAGFVYNMALTSIASSRGMTFQQAEAQYNRAIDLRIRGEITYQENMRRQFPNEDHSGDRAAPNLNIVQHPLFTASNGQLKFGKILGDTFGIDAVFGSLISPTGGLVGPANSNPLLTNLDPSNPVSIHGTVHDAAGYLYNAHNIGPGYDYLHREQGEQEFNPLSGQTNIEWWNEVYDEQGREVPWSARFLGRGSHALNPFVEGKAQTDKGYDHMPEAEEALRELAPMQMLYEIAAHDIAYKPNRRSVPQAVLDSMAANGYMTDTENGMSFHQGPMGFRAVLIYPKPGSGKLPLLAIRGTQPGTGRADLETVMTDLDQAAVGAEQFRLNAVLIQALLQQAGGRADVTGHSLGGAMAQHTAVNFSSMVASVTTFQSPGIDQESVDRFNNLPEEVRPLATHHIVTGDVVDKAGQGNIGGDVYEHDFGQFLNLYQMRDDLLGHMAQVRADANALLDIDFRSPGQNATDFEALKASFGNLKNYMSEIGGNVGAAHSMRVFSAGNYADIRERHGVQDEAFANGEADSGNMSGETARLGQFSGHPHQDERRLAEALRSTLGPELQRLFHLVFRAMDAYDAVRNRARAIEQGARDGLGRMRDGISDAAQRIRDNLPF